MTSMYQHVLFPRQGHGPFLAFLYLHMWDGVVVDDGLDACLIVQVLDQLDARLTCDLVSQLLVPRVASVEILHMCFISAMYPIII